MVDFGNGAKGAAGGAMAGSAFGPWGTAIGGAVGGALGLFGGDGGAGDQQRYKQQLAELSKTYANRQAPQLGAAGQAGPSNFRANQAGLISQLEAMARGEGPSAAAIQMREAMDRAAAAQTSAAATAGGRGVNQGAAYLNAANNGAAIMAQGARDTATLRAQEQANAVGQLGQTLGQARGQDDQMSQYNTSAQNQFSLANLQAKLQTMGLNDEAQIRALMGALGVPVQPSTGDQLLAGGANALPSILQRQSAQELNNRFNVRQGSPAPYGGVPQGAITSTRQV